ncbi:Putative ribonuclease H2, subunit C [Septoria linicola]|uniref:Ribonuclease H2, subunit C n=1 Tax=Septoria linicola TaxID=215465 RepID=A0A9Q9EMK5_9PEZI|nr:putative ribonuclease H2, subunit C [Septoria linicola]USW56896.1 Putative ribonuclease H2, subunit C [Septoria linicola]
MLALQPSSKQNPLTPNLLPCKIAHSGPIPTSTRHWTARPCSDPKFPKTSQEVHLRGRKLRGKQVKLPEGYTGVVAKKTEKLLPQQQPAVSRDGEDEEDEEESSMPAEVKVMEQVGSFGEIMVWAHEAVPESEDVYVKGIEEWIGFAESVSACSLAYLHD